MMNEKQHVLELFASGDFQKLQDHLLGSLAKLRKKTIDEIESIIFDVDGKVRLKILEILMIDGGADLISLFISCIRSEKNALYAKSQMLLYREFKHQEALTALLSIEEDIDKDLKATYQRTLGRLLSRFSEHFYMSEFRAGQGDARRVKFAIDMMLRSPHPDYVPFLNEQILSNDHAYRREGLRALKTMGDAQSIENMFQLMTRLRVQHRKMLKLNKTLSGDRDPVALFKSLCADAGVTMDENRLLTVIEKVKLGEVRDALDEVLDGLELEADVRRKLTPYLTEMLKGNAPTAFEESRINNMMKEYGEDLESLLTQTAKTLGVVSARHGDEDFLSHLEFYLPVEESGRDYLLIAALSGYRSDDAYGMLVEYVNTCTEPDMLDAALDALLEYNSEDPPKGVEKLCFDEVNHGLRRKALKLMAHWGRGGGIVNRLLREESLVIRADALHIAAEYELEESYPHVLQMVRPDLPDSLVVAALEALRSFDRAETGKTVKPFLLPPNTLSIRQAALETLYRAGGPDRFELIHKTFSQNPFATVQEIIDHFMGLSLSGDFDEVAPTIIANRDFWLRAIGESDEGLRTKIVHMIERLTIEDEMQAKALAQGIRRLLNQYQGQTVSDDERRLASVADKFDHQLKVQQESTQRVKQMRTILAGLESKAAYQQAQSLRKLSQSYDPAMLDDSTANMRKLVRRIAEILGDLDASPELLLQAIAATGKLRHPQLFKILETMVDFPHISVRNAVKQALNHPVDESFVRPIESIFVLDDSRYITKQLAKVLAEAGYRVDFENDVERGMARISEEQFDLLILDLVMPIMDGETFLAEARKREVAPDLVVIVTSTRNQDVLQPLLKKGVDGLLLKPFRMDEMLTRIKELSTQPIGSP